ncbi:MAG: BON domain-containing protein, partial [Propionivibrio sp.]
MSPAGRNRDASARRLSPWLAALISVWLLFFAATADAALGDALETPEPAPAKSEAPATIDVKSNASSDADIARRLRQLFATLDGLADVKVEVNAGVVALSGEVTARAVHEQALSVAGRVQGVVDVQDGITVSQDVRRRLLPTVERLLAQITGFIAFLPLLAVALAVLAAFWWLAGRLSASRQLARRFGRNPFLRDLARQVVRMAVIGLGVVLALEILDATALLGTVLGAAGVFGLAVGFALRDTVENYIASL